MALRDELSEFLLTVYDHGTQPNALREADAILGFLRSREPKPCRVFWSDGVWTPDGLGNCAMCGNDEEDHG